MQDTDRHCLARANEFAVEEKNTLCEALICSFVLSRLSEEY